MDAKITKKRLGLMLSYDWIKIIAFCVGAIFLWVLVFTVTATRVNPAQQFTYYNFTGTHAGEKFQELGTKKTEIFPSSYEIIDVEGNDLTTSSEYTHTVLQARLQTHEGDLLFVADQETGADERTTDTEGVTYKPTYLTDFLDGYFAYAMDLEGENGFFKSLENYLNGYYNGGYETGTVNKAKVEEDFRARIKEIDTKLYRTEKAKQDGINKEVERIERLANAYKELCSYIDSGIIALNTTDIYIQNYDGKIYKKSGTFSIDLCPDARMENLKKFLYYIAEDENGGKYTTAEHLNVVFLDAVQSKYHYSLYDNIEFVNYLVRTFGE